MSAQAPTLASVAEAHILVASDKNSDANMVRRLLTDKYDKVFIAAVPDTMVADFDQCLPEVLVLAFDTLEKAERYYLGLFRMSAKIHMQRHRTVILCGKDDVHRASELCMKRYFDDYVLFWPMNHDAPRLPMVVYQALRELAALRGGEPSVGAFAAQARRLATLESLLEQHALLGGQHVEVATRAMEQAEQGLGLALGNLSQQLGRDEADADGAQRVAQAIARFHEQDVQRLFQAASESVQPLKGWSEGFRKDYAPHVESVRSLTAMASRVLPKVLLVDDDDLQRKIIAKILEGQPYQLLFATSGAEALNVLRTTTPEVILMDVQMPDIDGIEMTQRLKAVPEFATVPVVMITGNSGRNVVVQSLKAGATDFVVKPFDRTKLLATLARLTGSAGTA